MHKRKIQPGPRLEYYDIPAAAAYLFMGESTLRKAVRNREIRVFRPGRIIRIKHDDLARWVTEKEQATTAEVIAEGRIRRSRKLGKPSPLNKHATVWSEISDTVLRNMARKIERKMLKETVVNSKLPATHN